MLVEEAIYSILSTDPGVTALASTRAYPVVAPQKSPAPYLVYNKSGRGRQELFCGTDNTLSTRMQIDCYATTYLESVNLAAAVESALNRYRGVLGSPAVNILTAYLTNEFDLSEIEPGLYRQSQDWEIWHN